MSYRDLGCLGAFLMAFCSIVALGYSYNHLFVTFPHPFRAFFLAETKLTAR